MADDDYNQGIIDALKQTATHSDPGSNPAQPYIDATKRAAGIASQFIPGYGGGLQGVANQEGIQTPDWSKKLGSVLNSEPANAALGVIAGPKAATASKKLLNQYNELIPKALTGHVTPEEIYDQTKWFPGKDTNPRFEIPDTRMTTRALPPVPQGKVLEGGLAHFINHDPLFDAYPELFNTHAVRVDPSLSEASGSFNPKTKTITLGGSVNPQGLTIPQQQGLLHELQHGVQHLEGFNQGSSPLHANLDLQGRAFDILSRGQSDPRYDAAQRLNDALMGPKANALSKEIYMRLPGETEARNVEGRFLRGLGAPPDPYLLPHTNRISDVAEVFRQKNINIYPVPGGYRMHLLREERPGGGYKSPGREITPDQLMPQFRDLYDRLPKDYNKAGEATTMIGDPYYPWKTEDYPRHLQLNLNEYPYEGFDFK